MGARVKILLIEDNDVFRQALELLLGLRGDLEIVGSEPDGSQAVELCRELAPDVLLIDHRLPGVDGVRVTQRVSAACPAVAIVGLTAAAEPREIEALHEAGAVDCVRKDQPLDAIVTAVRRAAGRLEAA